MTEISSNPRPERFRSAPPAPLPRPVTPVPAHRGRLLALGTLIGLLFTVIWSAPFVDDVIGDNVAGALLSGDASGPAPGILAGAAFALVSGLAGSVTACNVAALGAVGPLLGSGARHRDRLRGTLTPLSRLAAGMLAVSAVYGAVVGVVGTRMPQFSTERSGNGHISPFLIQSMVVFGLIGLAMIYLALAAAGLLPDLFARVQDRFPNARTVFLGVLIGGFLIGRPFPLFRAMFRDAAESHDPLFGALAFCLQSLGNIVVLGVLFAVLALILGGRGGEALAGRPGRVAAITVTGLTAAGVFTFFYWDVRLLAVLDVIGWYPLAPWV